MSQSVSFQISASTESLRFCVARQFCPAKLGRPIAQFSSFQVDPSVQTHSPFGSSIPPSHEVVRSGAIDGKNELISSELAAASVAEFPNDSQRNFAAE